MEPQTFLQIHKRKLYALAALILFVWVVLFAIDIWRQQTMLQLTINAAPGDMSLFIGSKEIKHPGKIYLKPGDYSLYFTRPDFSSYSRTISAKKGEKLTIDVALYPTTDAGKAYVQNHQELQSQLQTIGGRQENEATNQLVEKYPLISHLPGVGINFTINYTNNSDGLTINVDHVGKIGKTEAMQWIRDNGFNPDDYNFTFNDLMKNQ
jgi:hypothetical protein